MRSQERKMKIIKSEPTEILKKVFDIWEERPRLITSETTSEPDFRHIILHLAQHNEILHVNMGQRNDSVITTSIQDKQKSTASSNQIQNKALTVS